INQFSGNKAYGGSGKKYCCSVRPFRVFKKWYRDSPYKSISGIYKICQRAPRLAVKKQLINKYLIVGVPTNRLIL
ncbi:MAG: hypothetical protein ACW980_25440, partial [Promethearchaeota archaeon]